MSSLAHALVLLSSCFRWQTPPPQLQLPDSPHSSQDHAHHDRLAMLVQQIQQQDQRDQALEVAQVIRECIDMVDTTDDMFNNVTHLLKNGRRTPTRKSNPHTPMHSTPRNPTTPPLSDRSYTSEHKSDDAHELVTNKYRYPSTREFNSPVRSGSTHESDKQENVNPSANWELNHELILPREDFEVWQQYHEEQVQRRLENENHAQLEESRVNPLANEEVVRSQQGVQFVLEVFDVWCLRVCVFACLRVCVFYCSLNWFLLCLNSRFARRTLPTQMVKNERLWLHRKYQPRYILSNNMLIVFVIWVGVSLCALFPFSFFLTLYSKKKKKDVPYGQFGPDFDKIHPSQLKPDSEKDSEKVDRSTYHYCHIRAGDYRICVTSNCTIS